MVSRYLLLVSAALALCWGGVLATAHAWVTEEEPNDNTWTANPVLCGDTVSCGVLAPGIDVDHFRVHVLQFDSLVATTFPCNGSNTNTLLALYDDHDSILAVNEDGGLHWFSQIRYRAPRTADYVLRVQRHMSFPDCTYCLSVDCPVYLPEAYDLCTTPRIIPSLPYYNEGTTLGMTSQCGTAAPDVFYRFHNPVMDTLFITVCADFFDARVQILGGCCNTFLDDADQGCNLGAQLTSYFVPPGDYFIMVEGTAANQAGNFSLEVTAQTPSCTAPGPVVLGSAGNFPLLDWPDMNNASYFVVWYSSNVMGPYDHLGTSFLSYFVDSTGFTGSRRFYKVTAVCPW